MNDLFDPTGQEEHRTAGLSRTQRRELDRQRQQASKRRRSGLIATLISVIIIGGVLYGTWKFATNFFSDIKDNQNNEAEQIQDFVGTGTEPVEITVNPGDSGSAIAKTLVDNGVIATASVFVNATFANPNADKIQPGTYSLYKELPAATALEMLLDLDNLSGNRIQITPGQSVAQISQTIKGITGLTEEQLEAAMKDVAATGLPSVAEGSYEGWLADGDYRFGPDVTAEEVISEMVGRTVTRLNSLEIPEKDWQRILNVASIVEKEAGSEVDMPVVASVIYNRLEADERLQMDSTVHYVHGGTSNAATTSDQRAEDNPWNTYRIKGLPKTPIASPSLVAVEAALNPEKTDYFYFVTINPLTKETIFSETWAEHEAAVELYRAWLREQSKD